MSHGHTLYLEELLKICVSLSKQACKVIHDVQQKREQQGSLSKVQLKDPSDPRTYLTEADEAAQRVILKGLRQRFGNDLKIVGEEEQDDEETERNDIVIEDCDVDTSIISPEFQQPLSFSDLVIFIDPVDGTREFVEGRLEAVENLIGISYRDRSIAGVVGLPFYRNTDSLDPYGIKVLYGVTGGGLRGIESIQQNLTSEDTEDLNFTISADLGNSHPVLKTVKENISRAFIEHVGKSVNFVVAGACGNKILKLLTGEADLALLNLKTSRWDTCATEALLRAAGGNMSTLFGWTIDHKIIPVTQVGKDDKEQYLNTLGVIATSKSFMTKFKGISHSQLCQNFLSNDPTVLSLITGIGNTKTSSENDSSQTAFDIPRSLTTNAPLTCADYEKVVFESRRQVNWVRALEKSAVRFKQSVACRVEMGTTLENGEEEVSTVFVKRIVSRELPYAMSKVISAPHKLKRDMKANLNEMEFLNCDIVKNDLFSQKNDSKCGQHVEIALPYFTQKKVFKDSPIDCQFLYILRDFCSPDWEQEVYFNTDHLRSAVKSLAKFHAFFWLTSDAKENNAIASLLWKVGTYWDPSKLAENQVDKLDSSWRKIAEEFGYEDVSVGVRLAKLALKMSSATHEGEPQTIIHGDPKSANFFFRDNTTGDFDVGLIDFQWTGSGLCATDVAYFLATSICPSILERDGTSGDKSGLDIINSFLQQYYNDLLQHLKLRNVSDLPSNMPSLSEFITQFRRAFLDLMKITFTEHWGPNFQLQTIKNRNSLPKDKNFMFAAYNKDESVARWVIKLALHYLEEEEKVSK